VSWGRPDACLSVLDHMLLTVYYVVVLLIVDSSEQGSLMPLLLHVCPLAAGCFGLQPSSCAVLCRADV
jgi:hypothetical protein